MVFAYIGNGSESPNDGANPFRPRSTQALVEDEIRTLQQLAEHRSTGKQQSKTVRRAIRESLPKESSLDSVDGSAPFVKNLVITHNFVNQTTGIKQKAEEDKEKLSRAADDIRFLKEELSFFEK